MLDMEAKMVPGVTDVIFILEVKPWLAGTADEA